MDNEKILIDNISKLQKWEFYKWLINLVIISILVFISPFLIVEKYMTGDYLTCLFLLLAEIVLIGVAYILFKLVKEKASIKNNNIYRCIQNPELVTEIIVSENRIHFEIKGMEDVSIFFRHREEGKKLVSIIRLVFGESKIVYDKKEY